MRNIDRCGDRGLFAPPLNRGTFDGQQVESEDPMRLLVVFVTALSLGGCSGQAATTKSVTFDVNATRTENGQIAVQGSIPITWAEWGIGAPSGGPAQVEDSGVIEFLLVFER